MSTDKVNPLVGLIKSPEEILRNQKNIILTKILEIINQQLVRDYYGQTESIAIDIGQGLSNHDEYALVFIELQKILVLKGWNIVGAGGTEIQLLPCKESL